MSTETPQVRLNIDGMPVAGVVELEIESVGYFSADRFNVTCTLSGRTDFFTGLGQKSITIEVAIDGFSYDRLIVGQLDNVRIDLERNEAVLTGRDLAARLIDNEIAETFVNQSASQIAVMLAERRGLTPNITRTSTPVGQYYEIDHARNALSAHARYMTEWGLLTQLAQAEGFALWVSGEVLNFGPWPQAVPVMVMPTNFSAAVFDLINALPMSVTVKSWNTRSKTVVSQSQGNGSGTTIIRPNMSPLQAKKLAETQLLALGQHEVVLNATMPGDTTLCPGMTLVMSGTESNLDRNYTVISVKRRLDGRYGFEQNVMACSLN